MVDEGKCFVEYDSIHDGGFRKLGVSFVVVGYYVELCPLLSHVHMSSE